ncbi:MAG: FHA domain-containing protein [Betaproteobacteria bacterium]|nr:FHA domain-containing protein [Betaproteobacteria bacterium]
MKSRFVIRFVAGPLHDKSFELGEGDQRILGKGDTAQVRLDEDALVSRSHARLSLEKGSLWIEDLGSRNGTFINGKKIEKKTLLRPGDKVTLGQLSCFQCSPWNALEPSRFASVVLTRVTNVAARMKRRPKASIWPQFLMLQFIVCVVVAAAWWGGKQLRLGAAKSPVAESSREVSDQRVMENPVQTPLRTAVPTPDVPRNFIWDEIVTISRRFGDTPPSAMDSQFQKSVESWIERFTKGDAHKRMFERKEKYWSTIQGALSGEGLPVELGYLVWIESEFNLAALSPVGALGLWQFMPGTARDFGLQVDSARKLDERTDPEKSSRAAAQYLSMLLKQFGTDRYLLAVASYNAGQNKIRRKAIAAQIRRAPKPDFWALRDQLPQETVDYVPKFLAAVIINRNPERW